MPSHDDDRDFKRILANLFRKAGWRVRVDGSLQAAFIVSDRKKTYIVEMKFASESRRDRLIPLLSQAILQAQTYSRRSPKSAAPLAVIASRRVPESVAEHLQQFASEYSPDVAVGVIDGEGFASFSGPGLDALNAKPGLRAAAPIVSPQRLPELFSDLNQWMLKILVGQSLPDSLINVPRERVRNASHLAHLAQVSAMSASRLVNQLANRGFLDKNERRLQLVRVNELLERWVSSNNETVNEIPAHWIIKRGKDQLRAALQRYESMQVPNQPRCCLGLFSAADALGLGFVLGASPNIYLERLTLDSLSGLGLMVDDSTRQPDVIIRIPAHREAIFRPSVLRRGVRVADVLQVWLDVSNHPARGREQARMISERVLRSSIGET